MGYLEFKSYVEYKMFLSLNQTRFIFLFHFFIFFYLFIFFYINNKANLDGEKHLGKKGGGGGGRWSEFFSITQSQNVYNLSYLSLSLLFQ